MKTTRIAAQSLLPLVGWLAFCAEARFITARAADYPIHLDRPLKVNQEFFLKASSQETGIAQTTAGGVVTQNSTNSFSVAFAGNVKVVEIDSIGRITKALCAVSNCVVVRAGKTNEALPPATLVTASVQNKEARFEANGKPLLGDSADALIRVIPLSVGEPGDDEIFGTTAPQAAGNSWPVRAVGVAALFSHFRIPVNSEDVEGSTTLTNLTRVLGVECLNLVSRVNLKKVGMPLAPGVNVKQSSGSMRFSGVYPVDPALGPLEKTEEFSAESSGGSAAAAGTPEITAKISLFSLHHATMAYPAAK